MKIKDINMFKKTLIAAALLSATSAFAGEITISGDAFKVGTEYLNAYTGTAGLQGDLETAGIGIAYAPGIALGINNTLKFTFTGGAISDNVNLKLQKITTFATHADNATIQTAIDDAADLVVEITGPADTAGDLANLKAAAIGAINTANAADATVDNAATSAAIIAINAEAYDTDFATTLASVKGLNTAVLSTVVPTVAADVADLVDFGSDANGDYTWVLFKITDNALTSSEMLVFNDTDDNGAADIVTTFTKDTIGSGDLSVEMNEAKDDTGVTLSAPKATAKTLVTTAAQFKAALVKANDVIDVEQDRIFFADAISDVTTGDMVLTLNEQFTHLQGLGIDSTAADFVIAISGSMQGVEQVNYNAAEMDSDNEATATGLLNVNTVDIEVDGTSNLETRSLGVTYMVTPAEANTDSFYLAGSAATAATAFVWKLNGSEVNFPYAPVGYSHIATNFEIANSGSDDGEVLLTAFDTAGTLLTYLVLQTAVN